MRFRITRHVRGALWPADYLDCILSQVNYRDPFGDPGNVFIKNAMEKGIQEGDPHARH